MKVARHTYALVVDTRKLIMTFNVSSTSSMTYQPFTDFSAAAIFVESTERLAQSRRIATLVTQAISVRGADWSAQAGNTG